MTNELRAPAAAMPAGRPAETWTGERRMLAACRLEPVDATPVWFMRQAGRSLAAYRALRQRHSILTLAKTPDLSAEVTLLPVRDLGVDAAVLFADIVLPLEPMGVALEIQPDVGPVIHDPIRSAGDVDRLRTIDADADLPFVMDALRLVRRELDGRAAVIGFSGSPFTLACYLIEGRPSRDYALAKSFMYAQPDAWHRLMARLSAVVVEYLAAQVRAGAQVLQLFDSWVGILGPADYAWAVQPHVRSIFERLGGTPIIHFGTGCDALLPLMAEAGGDVIGLDARSSINAAWRRIGPTRGIQGNLDPARPLAGWRATEAGARHVLDEVAGRSGHIFNLGHGVLPDTDPGVLRTLVEYVHDQTRQPADAA